MKNFNFASRTKIHFGEGSISYLEKELENYGDRILLLYGGGSIKKTGIYDSVIKILKKSNKKVFEVYGVMPNPTYAKVLEGTKACKENNIDLILAVGGGSVIDCAKAIAVSTYAEGDAFKRYWLNFEKVDNKTIPVASILTMAGTGSEMNGGSVFNNTDLKIKAGRVFENQEPVFSILDPVYTYTVPKYQMLSGIFDIMSHLMETYFSGDDDNVSDDLIEALLKSLIKNTKKAIVDQKNYEARSNIMWIATLALNGITEAGKQGDWQVHGIEHQIGAYTDCAHGMGLAAISPAYYRHLIKYAPAKFVKFAKNVFNVNRQGTDIEIGLAGIDELEKFIKESEMVYNLKELGVTGKEMLKEISDSVFVNPNAGYHGFDSNEIYDILLESYKD